MKSTKVFSILLTLALVLNLFTVNAFAITRSNQDATGYNATGSAMANWEMPEIGCVAVHPSVKYGSTPIIPFGTFLYVDSFTNNETHETTSFVPSPEGELTILKVGDIGDKNYNRGLTTYFVDLFWGDYTVNIGKSTITYHY